MSAATYDAEFFQSQREGAERSARVIVPLVMELVRPASVLDVGCGVGTWLSVFRAHGVTDCLGVDGHGLPADDPYPLVEGIRPRILLDQDPGYTHLWAAQSDPGEIFGEHDLYFTVGANVGSPRCAVPTAGIPWRRFWNPVVLDWWKTGASPRRDRFTTAADWRSYGYLEFENRLLGPKAEEFRKFLDLPRRAGERLELVLNIDPGDPDLADLRSHGWRVEGPAVVATPARYRRYVTSSVGEFSCAKGGYVGTRCGWFSERSSCFLAAGRPVVVQATGFEDVLPTGEGLFAVATVEEAAEGIRAVRRDYRRHSTAARRIAEDHFDSGEVLHKLLDEAGIA